NRGGSISQFGFRKFGLPSDFVIRHSSFISRLPPERVLQNRLVSRQFVRRPVVPERDADNPGPGMFHGPDRRIEIGRASCRERVEISVDAVVRRKKITYIVDDLAKCETV